MASLSNSSHGKLSLKKCAWVQNSPGRGLLGLLGGWAEPIAKPSQGHGFLRLGLGHGLLLLCGS